MDHQPFGTKVFWDESLEERGGPWAPPPRSAVLCLASDST